MNEELLNASKERISDLLEKINGGMGEDISYDEQFEELKQEAEKLSSVSGEQPNWSSMAVTAEEILQEKSKDFRVACYLATCKGREGTVDGVADALMLVKELGEQFWEEMYPPLRRVRARAGMLGWMSDQIGPEAQDYKLTAKDHTKVQFIDALSKDVDAKYREIMGDHYPGISKLREAVRYWVRVCPKPQAPKKEEPKKDAAPAADRAEPAKPAPVAAPTGPAVDTSSPEEAEKSLGPISDSLVRIGHAIREGKPENPLAYKLTRLGSWLMMDSAPAPQANGNTFMPPPGGHIKGMLDGLLQSQDWLALLNAAENQAADNPLWLDPHRYSATAMAALGALFMKAHKEMLTQVALFMRKLPGLPNLKFMDGSGFADGATVMWLESEVAPVLGGDGDGGGGGGGAASALAEPIKEARDLAVKGELGKALDVIINAANGAPSPADKFRGKLAAAQLCLGASQWPIARSQLEGLTHMIAAHSLAEWDPRLCAEVYAGLYQSIHQMNEELRPDNPQVAAAAAASGDPLVPLEEEAAERAAFEMLCRLDPATALKLAGNK